MMIPPHGSKEWLRGDSLTTLYVDLQKPLEDPHIRDEMSLLVANLIPLPPS
jgi:hypothetical protein